MLTKAKITFKIVIFNRFICTMWLWSEKQLNVFNSLHFLCIGVHINSYKFTI